MSKKAAGREGNRVASAIKGNQAEFYVSDVDLNDSVPFLQKCADNCIRTLGKFRSAFIMITAGNGRLVVMANVPDELNKKINALTWVRTALNGLNIKLFTTERPEVGQVTSLRVTGVVEVESPFKLKDSIRSNAINYLRKNGLLEEEESSEEFFGFDDL